MSNALSFADTINPGKKEKTIMVVGATGAGKSTMIDGLIKFYLDVAWEEDSRFRMIDVIQEEHTEQNEVHNYLIFYDLYC